MGDKPSLRLQLCGFTSRVGPLRQENYFQAMSGSQLGHTRHRSWLDLVQRRPEVLDRGDMRPELVELARRKTLPAGGYIYFRRTVCERVDIHRGFEVRTASWTEKDIGAEEPFGFALERALHVRDCAVKIACDSECPIALCSSHFSVFLPRADHAERPLSHE